MTLRLDRFDTMPLVGAVMTPFPHFVRPEDSIETVESRMRKFDIHHVPVQSGVEVIGVISDRDLDNQEGAERVADIELDEPYIVGIATPLAEVAREMCEQRHGSAVVVRKGKLAGILSVTDACRLLAEVLEESFPKNSGDAA